MSKESEIKLLSAICQIGWFAPNWWLTLTLLVIGGVCFALAEHEKWKPRE